jgi:hypothetical protein
MANFIDIQVLNQYLSQRVGFHANSACIELLDKFQNVDVDTKKIYFNNCITKINTLFAERTDIIFTNPTINNIDRGTANI